MTSERKNNLGLSKNARAGKESVRSKMTLRKVGVGLKRRGELNSKRLG